MALDFGLFGQPPSLFDFRAGNLFGPAPSRFPVQQPRQRELDIAALLPPVVEPDYPDVPQRIADPSGLTKDARRQLLFQQLLNLGAAIGGPPGEFGSNLVGAAGAGLQARAAAIEEANRVQQEEYMRRRQLAEIEAKRRAQQALRAQQEAQIQAQLAVGRQAIDLAGGEEADPSFANRVYGAIKMQDPSALQKLLGEAPRRAVARTHGVDPDDPIGLEALERDLKALDDLEAKKREEETLGPIRMARDLEKYEQQQKIQQRYPAPQQPFKPWLLGTNLVYPGAAGANVIPIEGLPESPDLGLERDARAMAREQQKAWNERSTSANTFSEAEARAEAKAAANSKPPRPPAFVAGDRKPFDLQGTYVKILQSLRHARDAGRASEADTKKGTKPDAAPVGIGGSKPEDVKPTAKTTQTGTPKPDTAGTVAAVEAQLGHRLFVDTRKVAEALAAAGSSVADIVAMIKASEKRKVPARRPLE